VGKSERIIILRLRGVNHAEMYLIEIGWGDIDWIDLAQLNDPWRVLLYTVKNLRVP
jgi:hypothetical protein